MSACACSCLGLDGLKSTRCPQGRLDHAPSRMSFLTESNSGAKACAQDPSKTPPQPKCQPQLWGRGKSEWDLFLSSRA